MKSIVKNALNNLKGGTALQARPAVDFPGQDETIVSPQYTVRVSAPEAADRIDVSIDQGSWLACRKAEGYWWYDWSGYDDGEHELIARTPGKNGRWLMSTPNEFMVKRTL